MRHPASNSPVSDASLRRRTLARRLVALSITVGTVGAAGALALAPREARAEGASGGLGVYVSLTFGKELGVGYGLEGHLLGLLSGKGACDYSRRGGVGGLFQIGGINGSTLRLVGAAQGGSELDGAGSIGMVGELGIAGHVGKKGGVGLHTGLLLQTPWLVTASGRAEWFLDEYSVGTGVRFPGTFGLRGYCIEGRPLRGDQGPVGLSRALLGPSTGRRDTACEDADWLAEEWASAAQAEAASVPAFVQLAVDLLAHDAPDALVEAALDAAEDEIRHARLCAALASRWSARVVTPVLPAERPRAVLGGRAGLERLAVESWLDGCLAEGAAAARALESSEVASEPQARRIQRAIAHDEANHARLGWRVLAWAMDRGGRSVVDAVRAHERAGVPLGDTWNPSRVPGDAHRHGRLQPSRVDALHEAHARRARRRLDDLFAA